MKYFTVLLWLLPAFVLAQQEDPALLKRIQGYEQELADAVAIRDTTIWKKYLHDSCVITTEDGSLLTRRQLLAEMRPLPAGYVGKIIIIQTKLVRYANTAVFSFVDDEYLELFNQKIHTQYKQTDTWMNLDGQWKKVAMQLFEIPKNPPPVAIDSAILKRYAGSYSLNTDMKATVYVEDGRLYVRKGSRSPQELFAETENVFFRKGDGRVNVIFLYDPSEKKYRMIERREGTDLVWRP